MIFRHWIVPSVLALAIMPAAAQPAAPASPGNQCFFTTQFENWRAADAKTIYIRVRGNHFYRLGMGGECFRGAPARRTTGHGLSRLQPCLLGARLGPESARRTR